MPGSNILTRGGLKSQAIGANTLLPCKHENQRDCVAASPRLVFTGWISRGFGLVQYSNFYFLKRMWNHIKSSAFSPHPISEKTVWLSREIPPLLSSRIQYFVRYLKEILATIRWTFSNRSNFLKSVRLHLRTFTDVVLKISFCFFRASHVSWSFNHWSSCRYSCIPIIRRVSLGRGIVDVRVPRRGPPTKPAFLHDLSLQVCYVKSFGQVIFLNLLMGLQI